MRSDPPRLRADAARNRERVLEAARGAFARKGAEVSLDEIAKDAKVVPGTLYRHFPTRQALIKAVYGREVEKLGSRATELAGSMPAIDALRSWLMTLVDHVNEKQVIASALGEEAYTTARATIRSAMEALVGEAVRCGDLREDVIASDFLTTLIGVFQVTRGEELRETAERVVDLLLRGAAKNK